MYASARRRYALCQRAGRRATRQQWHRMSGGRRQAGEQRPARMRGQPARREVCSSSAVSAAFSLVSGETGACIVNRRYSGSAAVRVSQTHSILYCMQPARCRAANGGSHSEQALQCLSQQPTPQSQPSRPNVQDCCCMIRKAARRPARRRAVRQVRLPEAVAAVRPVIRWILHADAGWHAWREWRRRAALAVAEGGRTYIAESAAVRAARAARQWARQKQHACAVVMVRDSMQRRKRSGRRVVVAGQ